MYRHSPEWSSHIPILIRAVEITTGPVLELGTGISSTPLLHMLCFDKDRKLVSYDHDQSYIDMFRKYRTSSHEMNLVKNWDEIEERVLSEQWGIIFVDHGPAERRIVETRKFVNNADFLILHDTEDPIYKYEEIYHLFKYRFDYTKPRTHTTVLSNIREFNVKN